MILWNVFQRQLKNKKMKIVEFKDEPMYALFAPDGICQVSTLAPDYAMCLAVIKMHHKAGLSESYFSLSTKGFKILPLKMTITENGTEERGFQKAKAEFGLIKNSKANTANSKNDSNPFHP